MRVEDLPADQHRLYEDVMAMLLGTFFVTLLLNYLAGWGDRVGYSVLGALTLNLIIALNHKPGRYIGVS
ncbi:MULTISPECIES: hypothetical protein [unclassified Halomonas]|uniref:hypothetical protein n=1 Tax=unclassified Halomonas TaxID=2609666 RepID=UPI004034AD88